MLTARGDEPDKVAGLDAGADDYITKPFSTQELLARIRAVLRRRAPEQDTEAVTIGELALDTATHRVSWNGPAGQGRARPSSSCCNYLMKHPERVHSRSQLLDKVWGDHVFIEERTVDVHVKRLRESLGGRRDGRDGARRRLPHHGAAAAAAAPAEPRGGPLPSPPCLGASAASSLLRRSRPARWLRRALIAAPRGLVAGARLVRAGPRWRPTRCCAGCAGGRGRTCGRGGLWGEVGERMRRACGQREQQVRTPRPACRSSWRPSRRRPTAWCCSTPGPHRVVQRDGGRRTSGIDPSRDLQQHRQPGARPGLRRLLRPGRLHARRHRPGARSTPGARSALGAMHPYGEGRKLLLSRDVTALEQAEAMRRDFVANVSHEIRTPLTVLAGFVETLQNLPLDARGTARATWR
jgi:hypothetical protein